MIVGLDTSVLVRVLVGEPEELAARAASYLLERQDAGDQVWVSDWVLAETYYALQHHYGVPKKDVLDALRGFLAAPGIRCPGEASQVLDTPRLETAKPGFVDRLIHRDYLRAGAVELVTFERSVARLPQVRVLTA